MPEGYDRGDVARANHEVHERPRLGLAEHVVAGVALPIRVLMLEVAVEVYATGAVLVDEAVAIVVDSLPVESVRPGLPLGRVSLFHEAWLVWVDHVHAERVEHAHDRDDAVAVQVVRGVFVHATIIVGIEVERVEPVPVPRTVEHRLGAVRVEPRHDIDDVLTQFSLRGAGADQISHRLER